MRAGLKDGRLLHDVSGATAIEYALLAALIGGVLVGIMSTLSGSMTTMYGNIESAIVPTLDAAGS